MHPEEIASIANVLRNGNRRGNPANAPRCHAMTRKATACQAPAVRGKKRCRMHGGKSPGAAKKNTNAFKHGIYTAAALLKRQEIRSLIRKWHDTIDDL